MLKKADFFIILFVIVAVSTVYSAQFFGKSENSGDILNVYVDGKTEYSFKLPVNEKKEIDLKTKYGYNKIVIENNSVYVEESDCRGKDCVNVGKISSEGNFIICAPHRVVIRIEKEKTEDFDAVTY